MHLARVRSGLRETRHEVIAIALDSDGSTVFTSGDIDRPFFYRSVVKPFQAIATLRAGASLSDEQLAMVCASHGGFPVHVALVESILDDHGLGIGDLACPPSSPLSPDAQTLWDRRGVRTPQRRLHNCSGKHAGWLAGCASSGWDTATYLRPDHPIQRSARDVIEQATGFAAPAAGVDGCGAPTIEGTVVSVARGFHRLAHDVEYSRIADAMTRFGALVADNTRPDGRFATAWGGPSKGGAEGIFAATRDDITIVVKALDGSGEVAVAALLAVATEVGALPLGTADWLHPVAHPPVLGGGTEVGRLEVVDL